MTTPATKPRYRVPTTYVDVSLDEFSAEDMAEYLRQSGYSVTGGTKHGYSVEEAGMSIFPEDMNRITTLLLCGQRDAAREFVFDLIAKEIGRRL